MKKTARGRSAAPTITKLALSDGDLCERLVEEVTAYGQAASPERLASSLTELASRYGALPGAGLDEEDPLAVFALSVRNAPGGLLLDSGGMLASTARADRIRHNALAREWRASTQVATSRDSAAWQRANPSVAEDPELLPVREYSESLDELGVHSWRWLWWADTSPVAPLCASLAGGPDAVARAVSEFLEAAASAA